MPTISENALTILRTMQDAELGVGDSIVCQDLAALSGLNEKAFDQADNYLLQSHYVTGTMGGMDGHRWFTAEGIEYLERALTARLPLSLDAERILQYAVEHGAKRPIFSREQIIEKLEIDNARYDAACQQLGNLELLKDIVHQGYFAVVQATPAGKRVVQEKFRSVSGLIAYTYNTTFDQRGQTVTYQYNAAGDINFGAVQNRMDLVGELEKLRSELTKAVDAEAIDGEIVSDARYQIEKAVIQAKKPEPDKKTIIDRLNDAKALLQGVTAAAGMVEALMKATELAQKLF